MSNIAWLIVSLGLILLGAELFVNGVEWLGKKLNLSEGAVGSVLAAVGTALPETMIPIIAIAFGGGSEGHAIGIGAILGAPLMLSTLAMFVTGMAVVVFRGRRSMGTKVVADYSTMSRDLAFFIAIFTIAIITGFIPPQFRFVQLLIAAGMFLSYGVYVFVMIKEERDLEGESELDSCYFARSYDSPPMFLIVLQVIAALVIIVFSAKLFVVEVTNIAALYAVPAFVLSLIIAPIATELPEKFNSVIWISREKDTLALGNITGAMVFQSSMIPAIGILMTDWQLTSGAMYSALLALASSIIIFLELKRHQHISAPILMLGGLFYCIFLIGIFKGIITG
ncbi:MAG: sodium:calcium antiporter [Syntrophomonadaceae bacterium]|nr:sodium:calcium antiporter [Syntrophomonadaceae bacterium]